jgi:hypothetical protein
MKPPQWRNRPFLNLSARRSRKSRLAGTQTNNPP